MNHENFGICRSLFIAGSTPSAWTDANDAGEDSGEVTLICKAAGYGHIEQRQFAIAQLLLGSLDATGEKPVVRR